MLFTGFADLESIIAAINQGHVFQFLKKPWQPEELEAAVRQAAVEYDRLTEAARERRGSARADRELQYRVSALENEVKRLGGLVPPPVASSSDRGRWDVGRPGFRPPIADSGRVRSSPTLGERQRVPC